MNFDLRGKIALVSGCSQGLGYECVKILAAHGADIYGVSIGDDSALKKEVEMMGRKYHSLTISLTTPDAIHTLIKEVLAAYGQIDILLNFAGILKKHETLDIHKQEWNTAMDINVTAAFLLSQQVIKQFQAQGHGGKIINASGIHPLDTNEYCTYYTGKGAIEAMSKYLAYEFAPDNIQINTIMFGFMTTGAKLQQCEGNEMDCSILHHIPARRWGDSKDIEGAVLLLASHLSDYITGACIPVDGGYSIR